MLLKSLTLTNVRAFSHAEFTFQPGMNVIIGINGVGKSTVLDTLRILLSQLIPQFTPSKEQRDNFNPVEDITDGQNILTAELKFAINEHPFTYLFAYPRQSETKSEGVAVNKSGRGIQRYLLPPPRSINKEWKTQDEQPIAIYFPARRSIPSLLELKKVRADVKDQAWAYVHALEKSRNTFLREFALCWLAQKTLADEGSHAAAHFVKVMNAAVSRFLEHYTQVRVERTAEGAPPNLLLKKGKIWLGIRQLSDGERGVLALVFDVAQRLIRANPKLNNPIQDGRGIVLIDELDIHLHPKWQRTIVHKLTSTFPNCQFIVTTHSPLIIGEVSPENIILLEEGQPPLHPAQSLGMDTDWILKYLMDAPTRNLETDHELNRIADLIEAEDYDQALDAIDGLRNQIGEFPELVRLQTRIDRLQLLGE